MELIEDQGIEKLAKQCMHCERTTLLQYGFENLNVPVFRVEILF